jgi:hypothetical protein
MELLEVAGKLRTVKLSSVEITTGIGERITSAKTESAALTPSKNIMRAVETFTTSASPEVVWGILADVEHCCDWTPTVTEIKALNGPNSSGEQ